MEFAILLIYWVLSMIFTFLYVNSSEGKYFPLFMKIALLIFSPFTFICVMVIHIGDSVMRER